jgi:hypothetical protein
MLNEKVTEEELLSASSSFKKDKIPGPNGWLVEIYLHFIDLLEPNLLRVIEEVRTNGKVLDAFNSTFLALIPKKEKPNSFDEFRPISLCNCVYKILAKVLTVRVEKIILRVISQEQFGFLEERQIYEAVGSAHEGLHSIKLKNALAMILKLDLLKAYDHVNWIYLMLVLLQAGFNLQVVKWIMGCITFVSFAILINVSALIFFKPSKGLRQGCHLLPLLFLLVAKGLSQKIKEAKRLRGL